MNPTVYGWVELKSHYYLWSVWQRIYLVYMDCYVKHQWTFPSSLCERGFLSLPSHSPIYILNQFQILSSTQADILFILLFSFSSSFLSSFLTLFSYPLILIHTISSSFSFSLSSSFTFYHPHSIILNRSSLFSFSLSF